MATGEPKGLRRVNTTVPRIGPAWILGLLALYAALVALQYSALDRTPLMTLFYDEFLYDHMAYEVANGQAPTMNYTWSARYPAFYPAFLVPAVSFGDDRFIVGRLINVLLYTSSLFWIFLLGRRWLSPGPAVIAAIAGIVGPGLFVPPMFLAENLYYPLSLLYLLAVIRAVEQPTWPRAVIAGVMAAAAFWAKLVAVAPIVMLSLGMLFIGAPTFRERLRLLSIKALSTALLLSPIAIGAVGQSIASTASETTESTNVSLAGFASMTANHFMAALLVNGPILAAGALAAWWRRDDRRIPFAALFVVSSIMVGAVWLALVRPNEPRVEERYQIVSYGVMCVLAFRALARSDRTLLIPFALACVAIFMPTHLLDLERARFWTSVSPGTGPINDFLQLTGPQVGRILYLAVWGAVALLVIGRPMNTLTAAAIVVVTAFPFASRIGGLFPDPGRKTDLLAEQSTDTITSLLREHTRETDGVIFAGRMHPSVPYAACALTRRPYWAQDSIDRPKWYPGSFDYKTGSIEWTGKPVERLILATRDGITRGGTRLAAAGDWTLFVLDDADPRLHSLLDKPAESRWFDPFTNLPIHVYLFRTPNTISRKIAAEITHGAPRAKIYLYHPPMNSTWYDLRTRSEFEFPSAERIGDLSRIDVSIENGGAKLTMIETVIQKP